LFAHSPPPEIVNEGAAAIVEYLKEMFQVADDKESYLRLNSEIVEAIILCKH
jgi:hypothetical protein